jgi:hypothetical protein
VGRVVYTYDGGKSKQKFPSYQDYTPIIVLTKSTKYGSLGPYVLKDEKGRIMENIWQFSKVYKTVPPSIQKYSMYDSTVIWKWPADVHVRDGEFTPSFWEWRNSGMNSKFAIRYPVNMKHRSKCIGCLLPEATETKNNVVPSLLGYIESRKKIYVPIYCDLVKKEKQFVELKTRLENGENLLICEVDVAYQNELEYYKNTYGVSDDFIVNNTMEVNKENITIMLNDDRKPFGHGYCLAMALLDKDKEWNI